jgi:hypothetical protein
VPLECAESGELVFQKTTKENKLKKTSQFLVEFSVDRNWVFLSPTFSNTTKHNVGYIMCGP